jgi:hypothetical protein
MPTFGLVVEGKYDEAALTELIRKCVAAHTEIVPRLCSGSIMNKFPTMLEDFRHVKQGTHVDKALVIRDANGKDPGEIILRMQGKISNRHYLFPVKFVAIVRELETWLLADDEAISNVTNEYSGKTVPRVNESLEDIFTPKEKLKSLLAKADVPYTDEVARKIGAATDIERLRYRCPGFEKFREAVLDC